MKTKQIAWAFLAVFFTSLLFVLTSPSQVAAEPFDPGPWYTDPNPQYAFRFKLSDPSIKNANVDAKRNAKNGDTVTDFKGFTYVEKYKAYVSNDPVRLYREAQRCVNSNKNKFDVTVKLNGTEIGQETINGCALADDNDKGYLDFRVGVTKPEEASKVGKLVVTATLCGTTVGFGGDYVLKGAGTTKEGAIGSGGKFSVSNLKPGTYTLEIPKPHQARDGYYIPGDNAAGRSPIGPFSINVTGIVIDGGSTKTITPSDNSSAHCSQEVRNALAGIPSDGAEGGQDTLDGVPSGEEGAEDVEEEEENCETKTDDFGWILCPMIRATDGALNWVDSRIQELLDLDRNYYDNDGIRGAWTNIRNVAFIILVPIILIMVLGTAFDLDLVSAYTVKKALPRLIAAILFISLSYTICVLLIEVFSVVGNGARDLITLPFQEPLRNTAGEVIQAQNGEPATVRNLTLSSLFDVGDSGNIISTMIANATLAAGLVVAIWLFTAPILMLAVTAFLILMLRQIFLVGFVLLSPLAILSWIFPGNDKLWKLWWGAFSKLLMMFPLIMVVIALGRVFAFIINESHPAGADGLILEPLMKLAAYMLPYAMIPFTFKIAGGIFGTLTGMVNDRQKGFFDKQRQKRAAKTERTVGRRVLQTRSNAAGWLQTEGSKGGRLRRGAMRFGAARLGGYNVEAAISAKNAQVGKEINDQIATGRDDDIRGLTVNKNLLKDFEGAKAQGLARESGGKRQYKSLGGAWVDEANVVAGHNRWGNDTFAQQAALSYEMRKAATEEELQGLATRYSSLATDSWGMSERQAGGAWIGSAFENQNQHLEFKGTDWKTGRLDAGGSKKFVDEIYEKKGSYPLAQMSSNTIEQLKESHRIAVRTGDVDQQNKIKAISETFMHEYGTGGIPGATPDEGGETDPAAGGRRQASTPGAAHVAERVRELAVMTGIYGAAPAGSHLPPGRAGTPGAHEGTLSPNEREQK